MLTAKQLKNNVLCVGDLHWKIELAYADLLPDGRREEKQEILDCIVSSAADCESVVFLGDIFNSRNNPSSVVKELTAFLERFGDKQLFLLSGNHENSPDGSSALDYLAQLTNKPWHIITNEVIRFGDWVFCPYFFRQQFKTDDNALAAKLLVDQIGEGDILFCHNIISGTLSSGGLADTFNEIVLDGDLLKKRFTRIFAGHIHQPGVYKNLVVAGSIFSETAGEYGKKAYIVTTKGGKVTEIPLPGRGIGIVRDPKIGDLAAAPKHHIIKCLIEQSHDEAYLTALKEELQKFDAHLLIFQIPKERKTYETSGNRNLLELDLKELLQIYATNNKKDFALLKRGLELIQ